MNQKHGIEYFLIVWYNYKEYLVCWKTKVEKLTRATSSFILLGKEIKTFNLLPISKYHQPRAGPPRRKKTYELLSYSINSSGAAG